MASRKLSTYGTQDPYSMTGGLQPLPSMSQTQPASPAPAAQKPIQYTPHIPTGAQFTRSQPGTSFNKSLEGLGLPADVVARGAGTYATPSAGNIAASQQENAYNTYWADVGANRGVEASRNTQRTDMLTKGAAALAPGAGQMYTMPASYWTDRAREATGSLTAQWQQGLATLDEKLRRGQIDKPTYEALMGDLNARMRSSVAKVKADTRKQSLEYGAGEASKAVTGYTGLMGQIPSSTYLVSQPAAAATDSNGGFSVGHGSGSPVQKAINEFNKAFPNGAPKAVRDEFRDKLITMTTGGLNPDQAASAND